MSTGVSLESCCTSVTCSARTGTAGNDFFLILDGHARVEVTPRKRSRLGPGQYFGEMSLLDGDPRSASVVAETPLRLRVSSGTAGLDRDSDVLIAQVIAVANESFRKELGVLPVDLLAALDQKLRLVLGL